MPIRSYHLYLSRGYHGCLSSCWLRLRQAEGEARMGQPLAPQPMAETPRSHRQEAP